MSFFTIPLCILFGVMMSIELLNKEISSKSVSGSVFFVYTGLS